MRLGRRSIAVKAGVAPRDVDEKLKEEWKRNGGRWEVAASLRKGTQNSGSS